MTEILLTQNQTQAEETKTHKLETIQVRLSNSNTQKRFAHRLLRSKQPCKLPVINFNSESADGRKGSHNSPIRLQRQKQLKRSKTECKTCKLAGQQNSFSYIRSAVKKDPIKLIFSKVHLTNQHSSPYFSSHSFQVKKVRIKSRQAVSEQTKSLKKKAQKETLQEAQHSNQRKIEVHPYLKANHRVVSNFINIKNNKTNTPDKNKKERLPHQTRLAPWFKKQIDQSIYLV